MYVRDDARSVVATYWTDSGATPRDVSPATGCSRVRFGLRVLCGADVGVVGIRIDLTSGGSGNAVRYRVYQ